MKKVSRRHVSEWGPDFPQVLEFLTAQLSQRGFFGPTNLEERCLFSFWIDTCESVRVTLAFSRFSIDVSTGVGLFDSSVVVRSKTLYLKTLSTDPWRAVSEGRDNHGYVPCYVDRLAHRKWAKQPSDRNPSWLMTADSSVASNLYDWLNDFDQLHLPHIRQLNSDSALISAMHSALRYQKPAWVKSDGPGLVRMPERLAALEERC
jgi:hypothetical protein